MTSNTFRDRRVLYADTRRPLKVFYPNDDAMVLDLKESLFVVIKNLKLIIN